MWPRVAIDRQPIGALKILDRLLRLRSQRPGEGAWIVTERLQHHLDRLVLPRISDVLNLRAIQFFPQCGVADEKSINGCGSSPAEILIVGILPRRIRMPEDRQGGRPDAPCAALPASESPDALPA